MEFISTRGMKNEEAPEGAVLVRYLEPSWGGWHLQYAIGYFDNPNDYEGSSGQGWTHDVTGNKINVVAYCKLPEINQESDNPFYNLDQKATHAKYGTYRPNLGCVGQ